MNLFYSPDYVGAAHAFETTRKAKWVADSLFQAPIRGIELVEPPPLTWDKVARVHDPEYIQAVQTGEPRFLAETQGFTWDPGLWPMVLSSNGGVAAAGHDALQTGLAGSLSSGLHHARRATGAGFCTFNGLAIAAYEALGAGAKSVLILDLDAHCGGGTASLLASDRRIWQADVSVDGFDFYGRSVVERSEGRIQLRLVDRPESCLIEVEEALRDALDRGPRFDLCLYNAGMDPFEGCSTGGMAGITREILTARERLVFGRLRAQKLPTAFVLAGGYIGSRLDADGLVELHRLTLTAAAESVALGGTTDPRDRAES
jgi:acetoin utilization deacetylase AcuC-like enzyme